jgi:adenylate cyclase
MSVYEELLAWQRRTKVEVGGNIPQVMHRYCRFMAGHGVDIFRSTMALGTLHPQLQALRYVWFDDLRDPGPFPSPALFLRRVHQFEGCTIDEALMTHGAKHSEPFRRSPFWPVVLGAPRLVARIERGAKHEYPIFDDLAEQGATHYAVYPLPGMDGQISVVTRSPQGFTDTQLSFIELSLASLSLLLDDAVKALIIDTVLDCYVGHSPAQQIKMGQIRPGAMMAIHGAIWFSDIRNYSVHTQNNEPGEFIGKLNSYYECVVPIIYEHHGEVLKFIGDAVLAIFADDDPDSEGEACRRALAAAQASNQALLDRKIEFDHGIGLHVGEFQFGNIGSLRRLDFTVIGNEVNVAARIEAKCSALQQRLLMSEAFVEQTGMPARLVDRVALKGIEGDFALYAPAERRRQADAS